jgi:hypothetical protein
MSAITQRAKSTVTMLGYALTSDGMMYAILLTAVSLLIASMCVTYYTDSTGSANGIWTDKMCLGYMDSLNCQTMESLPIITVIFGLIAVVFMATHVSIPFISGSSGPFSKLLRKIGGVLNDKVFTGLGITIMPLLVIATIFSVATLGTQLATPMLGSTLVDKSQQCTVKFKDGMALSTASTILFVFLFLMTMIKAQNIGTSVFKN